MQIYNVTYMEWDRETVDVKPINITYTFDNIKDVRKYFEYLLNSIKAQCEDDIVVGKNSIRGCGKFARYSVEISVSDINSRTGSILSDSYTCGCDFSVPEEDEKEAKGTRSYWPGQEVTNGTDLYS